MYGSRWTVSLELSYKDGRYGVSLDGKEVKGIQLLAIEVEPGSQPQVHIEMTPDFVANLDRGMLTWLVMCPNCDHNSEHVCEIPPVVTEDVPPPPPFIPLSY